VHQVGDMSYIVTVRLCVSIVPVCLLFYLIEHSTQNRYSFGAF